MKAETLLRVLDLGVRAAEAALRRSQRETPASNSAVDRVIARVAPVAEQVIRRVAGPAARRGARRGKAAREKAARRKRGGSMLGQATSVFLGAAAAGATTYVVVKEQQRVRERYRPIGAPFAMELLDVLATPGGGVRLEYSGGQLVDHASGAAYALVDGIPDFIAPAAATASPEPELTWVEDLVRPPAMRLLGRNSTGNAAFASAVAGAAAAAGTQPAGGIRPAGGTQLAGGWVLSVPAGRGAYEIEMARANPRARVLCVNKEWDTLLEARRRALAAGLTNIYYARGRARLLPVQDHAVAGVWTAGGIDRFAEPEWELTQMVRAARPGALVAGVSLVRGGSPGYDLVLQAAAERLPGARDTVAHHALLQAAGLRDVRLFRDGAFVRFTAIRA